MLFFGRLIGTFVGTLLELQKKSNEGTQYIVVKNTLQPQDIVVERILAGAIRIELISLVLETKAQPLYQTPRQRNYYKTKKSICQIFLGQR